jgi:hypothetical protein
MPAATRVEEANRAASKSHRNGALLLETYNPGDVAFVSSILDGNGIGYNIQNEHFASIHGLTVPVVFFVDKRDMKRAMKLMKRAKLNYTGLSKTDCCEEAKDKK